MLKLNNLVKAGRSRKRLGRGGSRGSTCGRGANGQRSRSGHGISVFFEGGQMPLVRRLPKRGFTNARFKKVYELVNLRQLQTFLPEEEVLDIDKFVSAGIIGRRSCMLKVLADGVENFDRKLVVHAHSFSKSARGAIEKLGGSVKLVGEAELVGEKGS